MIVEIANHADFKILRKRFSFVQISDYSVIIIWYQILQSILFLMKRL